MEQLRNRNNEMYLSAWYDDYLMKYVGIVAHPRFSREKNKSTQKFS